MSKVIIWAVAAIVLFLALILAFGLERTFSQEIADTDWDGCSDVEEIQYGMDPANPYDFLDVPPKDGAVSVGDILGIVGRFGLTEGHPDYYTGFDRSSQDGVIGPPDGVVAVTDIFLAVSQFGRTCTDVEWCGGNVQDQALSEPIEDALDPNGSVIVETVCYEITDDSGQVVDYTISEDELAVEDLGEESLEELPEGLPEQAVAVAAASELGLDQVQATTAGGPFIRNWSCERRKTWRDSFHIPVYSIKLHVDIKELKNAGIYTGAINVYNTWGDQTALWPWNLNSVPPIHKTYVYTEDGPWDFRIFVQKDVGLRATIAGNNLFYISEHMKWRNGRMPPPDNRLSCWWRWWREY